MFEIASKLWLSAWAESREKHTDYNIIDSEELSTTDYISVYGAFGLLQVNFYQNHVFFPSFVLKCDLIFLTKAKVIHTKYSKQLKKTHTFMCLGRSGFFGQH